MARFVFHLNCTLWGRSPRGPLFAEKLRQLKALEASQLICSYRFVFSLGKMNSIKKIPNSK